MKMLSLNMGKFSSNMETKMLSIANKMSNQRHFTAIRNTFMSILPIIIMGGLSAVISAAPVTETTTNGFLLAWANFVQKNSIIFSWIGALTLGAMAIYVCIGIGYFLCKHYKIEPFIPVLLTVFGFLVVSLNPVELTYASKLVDIGNLDGKGLLVAMAIGIITVESYRFMRHKNFGRIKMPDSVPASLSESFASLAPAIVIMTLYIVVFVIFNSMGTTLTTWLITAIAPQIQAADSLWFVVLTATIINAAWFFGIHNAAFWGIMGPLLSMNFSLNAVAQTSGVALPAILTDPFWVYFVHIGGAGSCFSIAILLMLSKSKQMKTVGRIGILPAFFGISEPITFGLPIMMNPFFFVPCFLTAAVNGAISFLLMSSNVIERTYAMLSWNMPNVFGAYFSTGDIKASLLIIGLLIIDIIIYFPFFKAYEKQQLRIENCGE